MGARLALGLPDLPLHKGGIWVHALSVGEVLSALPLVEGLAQEYPEREIVFTATTAAGLAVARAKLGPRVHVIFPMTVDAWWAVRKVINYVRPSTFILVETDVWPGLLDFLRRRGVPSLLVNGRISPRTFRSYRRAPCMVREMFDPLCVCLMQSDLDRHRLLMVGIEGRKVITTGNIKFDRQVDPMEEQEHQEWVSALGFEPGDPLWVAGSTHQGEEEVILDVFKALMAHFPRLRLILAPRDPGRAGDVMILAEERGLKAVLKTEVVKPRAVPQSSAVCHPWGERDALSARHQGHDLVVLDTVGELGRVYGLGSVCFVGGTLVPVGGHNLLEPAAFGIPVVFGPHTHNFVSMAAGLLEEGGGCRVHTGQELHEILECFLKDDGMRMQVGKMARLFVARNQGALGQVLSHVRLCVDGRDGAHGPMRRAWSAEREGQRPKPKLKHRDPYAARHA